MWRTIFRPSDEGIIVPNHGILSLWHNCKRYIPHNTISSETLPAREYLLFLLSNSRNIPILVNTFSGAQSKFTVDLSSELSGGVRRRETLTWVPWCGRAQEEFWLPFRIWRTVGSWFTDACEKIGDRRAFRINKLPANSATAHSAHLHH